MGTGNKINKVSGTLYEQIFIIECLKRELHPHPSIGDYLPHDLVVINSAGRAVRVQVKGTASPHKNTAGSVDRYRITAKSKFGKVGENHPLDCTRVDVMAAYVQPFDVWYLIPCTSLTSMSVWLFPATEKSKGQYERYKENWSLFR